jgi:predicted MFS family arabinose efflux permease
VAEPGSAIGAVAWFPPGDVASRRTVTGGRGLVAIVVARLAVNGGIRVVYPFVTVIAAGLGMSVHGLALLVASRALAGLAGPALARLVSPTRRRGLMLASELLVAVGCVLIVTSVSAPAPVRTLLVALGFIATGLARPLFDLPMQTWIRAHVGVADRGRALGLTELGWALSLAVTVPVAGVLIERTDWRSPFLLVVAMAAAGAVALVLTVPTDDPDGVPPDGDIGSVTPARLPRLRRVPTAVAIGVGTALAVAAAESLLMVHGTWLTTDFGMTVSQVGASTMFIVAAELLGAGVVIALADRVGLERTLFRALLASAVVYAGLGLVGNRIGPALAATGVLFVAFEVTIVVLIALATVSTDDRAGLLGTLMAAVACGNAAGAFAGPLLFAQGGIALSGGVSAAAAAAAVAVLWRAGAVGSRVARQRASRGNEPRHRAAPAGHRPPDTPVARGTRSNVSVGDRWCPPRPLVSPAVASGVRSAPQLAVQG